MKRKALLSIILSTAMILGSVSPAFAAGQMPSDEVTVSTEASAPESPDEVVIEDDSTVNSEEESVDDRETIEEETGTETESEEDGIGQEDSDGESKSEENLTDSAEEEEEKPETLVGAEGNRVLVGDNVTAGFDSETGTLTFYSQSGTLSNDWYKKLGIDVTAIEAITISDDSDVMYLPADSSGLFSIYGDFAWADRDSLINLRSIDLSKANTANVTKMNMMFLYCRGLKTLDLSGFDTSNVTNMSLMFMDCDSLETLDISGFDTSGVTDMGSMFYGCRSLRELDVSGFDTSNVRSVASMFSGCSGLQVLDLSSFDLTGLTPGDISIDPEENDSSMLYYCGADIILTPVNVQKTIDLPYTFADASGTEYNALPQGLSESIRLTKNALNIADATVTGIINKTYTGAYHTQNPTVKLGNKTLTKGTDYTLSYANNMNAGTATVTITGKGSYTGTINKTFTINKASITGATVTGIENKAYTGTAQTQNPTVKLDGKTLGAGTDYSLSYVNNTNPGTATVTITGKGNYTGTIKKTFTISVVEENRVLVGDNVTAGFDSETGTLTFYSQSGTLSNDWYKKLGIDVTAIEAITISDDSDVMYLPADSSELFFIYDHSGWGEGNSLINLRSINLSKANTANVTKMNKMFLNCSSLKTLDLSGFDTSNVTDMSLMFMYCKSLEILDLSGFDTSGVTGMEYMFFGCSSLRALDLSGFDTSNVRSVASMFSG